jgi:hypothetical protein
MSQLPGLVAGVVLTMLSPVVPIVVGSVIAVWLATLCRARWFMLPGLLLAGIFWLTQDRTTLVTKTLAAWQQFFAEPTAWHFLPFVPLGLPLGLVVGGLVITYKDGQLRSQEWHPLASKRQEQQERRLKRRMRRAAAEVQSPRALGVLFEGTDLYTGSWQVKGWFRRVLVPSQLVLSRPSLIVAGPGAGKTEYLKTRARIDAAARRRHILIDCKGTDPELPGAVVSAFLSEWPDARIKIFPAEALDMWRGSADELISRLMSVITYSEPYYRDTAKLALQLAMATPDIPPPTSSAQLLGRLNLHWLREAYAADPAGLEQVESLDDLGMAGCRRRYATFFRSLQGRFDGQFSYEDCDLAVLVVPTLADREDADAAVRIMLADALHWAGARKARTDACSFVIDEFSAVQGGRDAALDLAERGRDPGVAVLLTAQSLEGIGHEQQAARLIQACSGGIVLLRCARPEPIAALAGTMRQREPLYVLDGAPVPREASFRLGDVPRINANQVRAADPGEAWIIDGGRSAHVQVIQQQPTPQASLQALQAFSQAAATVAANGMGTAYLHRIIRELEPAAAPAAITAATQHPQLPGAPSVPQLRALPAPPEAPLPPMQLIAWLTFRLARWFPDGRQRRPEDERL